MDLQSRYRGALVGVHVGDSIGAPYETWSPKQIAVDLEERGGLTFFDYPNPWAKDGNGTILPAGRPTDDSDQTADLAWSLLECDGINPAHLRKALRDSVVRHKSRLWAGKATGAGSTTRDTLSDDPERVQRGLANTIGTNGSLMRASPMALWQFKELRAALTDSEKFASARKEVYVMSNVTHGHQHSKTAAWVYTCTLASLLAGEEVSQALYALERIDRYWESHRLYTRVISAVEDKHHIPYDPGAWPARGTAEFSLYVALYALQHSTSFAHGIELAVKVGGDTDTYGAIAGGLLGAYYGYEAIPQAWRNTILGHDVMVSYADQIYERRCSQL